MDDSLIALRGRLESLVLDRVEGKLPVASKAFLGSKFLWDLIFCMILVELCFLIKAFVSLADLREAALEKEVEVEGSSGPLEFESRIFDD